MKFLAILAILCVKFDLLAIRLGITPRIDKIAKKNGLTKFSFPE